MIILTGSRGFIGSHFKKVLSSLTDEEILCVEKNGCFDFLNSFKDWDKVSLIFHQGAIADTTTKDVTTLFEYNVKFSIELFKKAIEYQIPVKYASSASVYGTLDASDDKINPQTQYAISKLQLDYWVKDHIEEFYSVQGFRYFNVYGSNENHKKDQASPVSKFVWQIKDSGRLKLFEGSENIYRDFISVNDLVNIVVFESNKKPSGVYDLGTSQPISFLDVAKLITEKHKGKIEYIPFPKHFVGKYQYYTCAKPTWNYKFTTVKEYLDNETF